MRLNIGSVVKQKHKRSVLEGKIVCIGIEGIKFNNMNFQCYQHWLQLLIKVVFGTVSVLRGLTIEKLWE